MFKHNKSLTHFFVKTTIEIEKNKSNLLNGTLKCGAHYHQYNREIEN